MEPFSQDKLALYFSGTFHYAGYEDACDKAHALRVHADGDYPIGLIEDRRPHESGMVKDYRKTIWQPITKPYFGKVLNSLAKIRRSTEWSIRFENDVPKTVAPGETLEAYINGKLPTHTSLTNWAFSALLREYAVDANAWVAVVPMETATAENQYMRPRPLIFCSEQVIDYGDDYLVAVSAEKSIYQDINSKQEKEGDIIYIITDTYFQRWEQKTTDREFVMTWEMAHTIGQRPAFHMRGVIIKSNGDHPIYETRLAPMLPRLDEAAREYSDLQAEVVQHIHSEKWVVGQKECVVCHGKTVVSNGEGVVSCTACNGSGWEPRGPYTELVVDKVMAGEPGSPIPPAGYIQKDTNIVEVQDKRIDRHIFHALAAVNMEFLAQAPVSESGVAKAYDADETNNFVHAVAEDLVAMLDSVVLYISELRYGLAVASAEERAKMLPVINVPDRFDIFSAAMVEQELNTAKQNNVSTVILNALEEEYANKKFSNDPRVRAKVELTFRLDPLANISEDNKVMMLQNGGVTKETYIISCNIGAYITRAMEEHKEKFLKMSLAEQKAVLAGYAKEQIDATSMARQVISEVTAA